jgi:hypothetical protein
MAGGEGGGRSVHVNSLCTWMMPQGVGKAELSHCGGRAGQPEVRQEAAQERGGGRREAAGLTPRSHHIYFYHGVNSSYTVNWSSGF